MSLTILRRFWPVRLVPAIATGLRILMIAVLIVIGVPLAPVIYAQASIEQGRSAPGLRDMGALPFIGPPAAVDLDREFDALSRAAGLDPAVAKALDSIAGKEALWRAIGSYIREHRSAIVDQALSRYAGVSRSTFAQPEASAGMANLFRPLISYASGLQQDLQSLDKLLQRVASSLKDDSGLALRLRNVLQSPGAVEAVYVSLFYPVYLSRGEGPGFEDMLVRNSRGKTEIATRSRAGAEAVVNRLKPMLATVNQLTRETVAVAASIVDKDSQHRDFRNTLSDPMTTAITASLHMRRNPGISARQLSDTIRGKLNERFISSGEGRVLAEGQSSSALEKNLKLLRRLRVIARSNANGIQVLLSDMNTGDSLDREFKSAMSTDLAAASLISEDAFKPISEVFLKSSIFGSSLLEGNDGSWSINPHRVREMGIMVAYLEQRLRDMQEHGKKLGKIAATLQPGGAGQKLILLTLLQMVEMETLRDIQGLANYWIDENFEQTGNGYRVRRDKTKQIQEIANSATDNLSPLTIKPGPEGYSDEYTYLLQSSAYIYLGTRFASEVYFNEFEDHYAARVWGIFDWNAQIANDPEAFRQSLSKQAAYLRRIAKTHKKVVIYIFHTPKWLSASNSMRDFDGRPAYLMASPKDYDAWRQFVGETVQFVKKHLAGVEVYYEVWNEPEIYWPEGTDEYLRLYAETVRAIKQAHPAAKVGGAAVNGWDGKARGARGGDPLNFELIRYTVKNDIPLDFIAWHHFERPLSELETAKKAYVAELRRLGVKSTPEFVISEWSIPGRGTGIEAVAFAKYMLALYRSEVAIQTVSAWDEFSVLARPNNLPPWGMLTQQGLKKPMFHVHRFFDRLSRDSEGIRVFESDDGKTTIVASRKRDGSLELIVWELRYKRRLEAAIDTLRDRGVSTANLRQYGSIDQLELAIRDGKSIKQEHSEAFRKARETYLDERYRPRPLLLRMAGVARLRVTASETVGIRSVGRQIFTSGPDLALNLPRGEVMWLRLELD